MALLLVAAALMPWIILPVWLFRRLANGTTLQEDRPEPPLPVPRVSVVLAVRNEEQNIERCVGSILRSEYPDLEVIVVDDGSEDRTREIVSRLSEGDARLSLMPSPPLATGWFGQQWAALNGAQQSTGSIICFVDADTWHEPEFIARAVNCMRRMGADMLSVNCRQVMGTFGERVAQPQVLLVLGARYGGSGTISSATREEGKFAGGPCMLVTRDAYEAVGGHEVAKGYIATDVMLARGLFRAGKTVMMTDSGGHAFVRMYRGLADLVRGWSKNLHLGTRISAGEPGARDLVKTAALFAVPLFQLLPVAGLLGGVATGQGALAAWGAAGSSIVLACWLRIYAWMGIARWHALVFPVGTVILFWIIARSVGNRGRVRWKGREYKSR